MIYPTLSRSAGKSVVRTLLEDGALGQPVDSLAVEGGVLPREDMPARIEELSSRLAELRSRIDSRERARFDAEASVVVHRTLGTLSVRTATDSGFWRYLSCGPLFETVRWRYPDSNNIDHFGIGKAWEALPERLWFRAHVGLRDDAADSYELVRRGGVDFWISGLIRKLYSSNPLLARAFIEFQYPRDGEFNGDRYSPATLGIDEIREMYKRLRHLTATTEYAILDGQQARQLVDDLSLGLPRKEGPVTT